MRKKFKALETSKNGVLIIFYYDTVWSLKGKFFVLGDVYMYEQNLIKNFSSTYTFYSR